MEQDIRLLKTVKNSVLQLVLQSGIDPSEFQWREARAEDVSAYGVGRYTVSIIEHSSGYFYRFGAHTDTYSPGESAHIASQDISFIHERWDERLSFVYHWLRFLKREIEAPDLWAVILQEKRLLRITSAPQLTNAPFTRQEKEYVITQLDDLKHRLISDHHLQLQQAEAIEQGIAQADIRFPPLQRWCRTL